MVAAAAPLLLAKQTADALLSWIRCSTAGNSLVIANNGQVVTSDTVDKQLLWAEHAPKVLQLISSVGVDLASDAEVGPSLLDSRARFAVPRFHRVFFAGGFGGAVRHATPARQRLSFSQRCRVALPTGGESLSPSRRCHCGFEGRLLFPLGRSSGANGVPLRPNGTTCSACRPRLSRPHWIFRLCFCLFRCTSLPLPPVFAALRCRLPLSYNALFVHLHQLQQMYAEATMYYACSQGVVQAFVTGERRQTRRALSTEIVSPLQQRPRKP